MRRLVLLAVGALIAVGGTREASAHQASFTYGRLTASDDGRRIDYQLELRSTDLYEALERVADGDPPDSEILAGASKIYDYVAARIALTAPGQACRIERAPLQVEAQADRFAVLRFALICPAPVAEAVLDYNLFFDLDPDHVGLVTVDGEVTRLRAPDDNRLSWALGRSIDGLGGFVASGVEHIRTGLDHILFLIALLLIAVIRRVPPPGGPRAEGGVAQLRSLAAALRTTAAIVSSFTVAHSITLIAAALGWFELPSRLVESLIAASIVYVAVENVVRPDPPRRYLLTFGFGLIHGLGFAAMLTPLLPHDQVLLPLLAFNLGVELGQLGLVVLALPLLYAVARVLGPERYRARVVTTGAVVLGALGGLWLVERAFAITIVGL